VFFDRNGNYERIALFDSDDNLLRKMIPKRNGTAIAIEEELTYNSFDKLEETIKIISHSSSKIVYEKHTTGTGKTETGTLYFENGRVIKTKSRGVVPYTAIVHEYSVEITYDEDGYAVEETMLKADGTPSFCSQYEYVAFDHHNNWTKRINYSKKAIEKPIKITTRVYKYYEN